MAGSRRLEPKVDTNPGRLLRPRDMRARVRVAVEAPRAAYAARVVRAAAPGMLRTLRIQAELSVALVGDAAIRRLNRQWRGKDRATDVLSFPQEARSGLVGDVVISLDTARRQAREGGWSIAAELRRLLAHGVLHCVGHDHERPEEARRMAAAERRLLGHAGMVGEA
jgi:probable rRNA maturation factor